MKYYYISNIALVFFEQVYRYHYLIICQFKIIHIVLNDFLKIINSKKTKVFLDKGIQTLYDRDFPFCSYIGINYNDTNLINVKFYFTAFKKIDFNLTKDFFPYSESIHKAYTRYKESNVYNPDNMGVGFIQKQNMDGSLLYTFGLRLNEKLNPPINHFNLLPEDKVVDDYFAFETDSNQAYPKYYHIITNRKNIEYLLKEFELDINFNKVNVIEYSEFGDKQKILAGMYNVADVENYLIKNSSEEFIKLHNFITQKFDFIPVSPGKYLNKDVKSIHYFDKGDPIYFRNSLALLKINELLNKSEI